MDIIIRPVELRDNVALAHLVRRVLTEFNANKPGTAFFDEGLDHLSNVFTAPGSAYWVAEEGAVLIGGAGIYPTAGLPEGYCELVKLYLHADARKQGIGKKLLTTCLASARKAGYTHVYLETMPELIAALPFYERAGFSCLPQPLGNSGHYSCCVWMEKKL